MKLEVSGWRENLIYSLKLTFSVLFHEPIRGEGVEHRCETQTHENKTFMRMCCDRNQTSRWDDLSMASFPGLVSISSSQFILHFTVNILNVSGGNFVFTETAINVKLSRRGSLIIDDH